MEQEKERVSAEASAEASAEVSAEAQKTASADTPAREDASDCSCAPCAEGFADAPDCSSDGTASALPDASDAGEEKACAEEDFTDYERQAEEDMRVLCALFPALAPNGSKLKLGDLQNPTRFAELRAAGLTAEEAFLASNYRMLNARAQDLTHADTTHMKSALPRAEGNARTIPASLLVRARTLFEGLSDGELASLYRRVSD